MLNSHRLVQQINNKLYHQLCNLNTQPFYHQGVMNFSRFLLDACEATSVYEIAWPGKNETSSGNSYELV